MRTSIKGGWVVAFDGTAHKIYENGEVVFENDRILYCGPKFDGRVDRVVDAEGKLVSPGFINTHVHVGVEINAQMVDINKNDGAGIGISYEYALKEQEKCLTENQMKASSTFGLAQLMRMGSTTIMDAGGSGTIWWLGNYPEDEEILVDVAGKLGARLYVALAFRDEKSVRHADGRSDYLRVADYGKALLDQAIRFAEKYRSVHSDRVRGFISPHAVDNNSAELLQGARRAATELDVLIQVHCSQSVREVEYVHEKYGTTPVGLLHQIGFLGPDVILGHAIYLQGHSMVPNLGVDDLALVAETGTSIAHSPLVFFRRGHMLESLPRYWDAGVNVSLATDMWPVDIIQEMRLAWYVGKAASGQTDRPAAEEIFSAATLGGAKALGRTDIGRLAEGAKADIVVIDLTKFHYGPVRDPLRALLTAGTGHDVEHVYVDGQLVVEDGNVLNCDMDKAKNQAEDVMNTFFKAASERDWAGRAPEEIRPKNWVVG